MFFGTLNCGLLLSVLYFLYNPRVLKSLVYRFHGFLNFYNYNMPLCLVLAFIWRNPFLFFVISITCASSLPCVSLYLHLCVRAIPVILIPVLF